MRGRVAQLFCIHGARLETIFQGCREHALTLTDMRHEVAAGVGRAAWVWPGARLALASPSC
jgi:hypothetical protein